MSNDIDIPNTLVEYLRAPPLELTDIHIRSFVGRMTYVAEVAEKVAHWEKYRDESLFSMLNNVEVDLLVILAHGMQGTGEEEDSTYIMHCSWPSDCNAAAMYEGLPKNAIQTLGKGIGKMLVGEQDAEKWVMSWSSAMQSLLTSFSRSQGLDQAMGAMLAIDIMITNMLSFVSAMRLNSLIEK
ncbi:hypothetical protein ACUXAV_005962 [Cupriavidus metallidurans]|jgi:hypothetical protein|uniref:hypothetical protein n=1 Tax=Cupriavidus TaxID=106589 RepID=UPI000493A47B|nr:hypothetical protein [Cupriavidus metallidurans]MDE4917177.1 hypothetical protein [Cupriavidus metallidurans]MDE4920370.1 hypothetical protein [Cupriavidus metallidurans]